MSQNFLDRRYANAERRFLKASLVISITQTCRNEISVCSDYFGAIFRKTYNTLKKKTVEKYRENRKCLNVKLKYEDFFMSGCSQGSRSGF